MNELVSVNILTWNSERYINACLRSVLAQRYRFFEINIVDNDSGDGTKDFLRRWQRENSEFSVKLVFNESNVGFAPGHNQAIGMSRGKYILCLNHDIVLDDNFISEAARALEADAGIGSLQGKICQLNNGLRSGVIDTTGFLVFRSGRIIDRWQGEGDSERYGRSEDIFAANGAAPVYRRASLEDAALPNKDGGKEYFDNDFGSYVEDVDLGWRLRWRGWGCSYLPSAVAWHDRTTSKKTCSGVGDFISHRRAQSSWARRIGWRNQWFLLIKNQSAISFIRFFPVFLWRQMRLCGYLLLFEQKTLFVLPEIFRLFPKMWRKRKIIMAGKKVDDREMEQWFK